MVFYYKIYYIRKYYKILINDNGFNYENFMSKIHKKIW